MGCTKAKQARLLDRARVLRDETKTEEARKVFEEAIALDSSSTLAPQALLEVAELAQQRLNRPDLAELYYSEVLKVVGQSSERTQALKRLSKIYLGTQKSLDKAALYLQELLDNLDNRAERDELWYQKAQVDILQNSFLQARTSLQKLIQDHPESPLVFSSKLLMAETFLFEGNGAQAEKDLAELIKNTPEGAQKVEAQLLRAQCLETEQRWREALRIYEQIKKKYPNPQVVQGRINSLLKRRSKSK